MLFRDGAEPLSEAEERRYEELVGVSVGDRGIFERKRQGAGAKEKLAGLKDKRHVGSLPRRPQLAEPGSIELPRFVFTWLKNAKDGNWTVAHVGVLATLMLSFENRDASLIAGARFEEAEGEPVLVIPGGVGGVS